MWIWLLALGCSDAPPAQPPEAKTKALAPPPRHADPATFNAGGTGGPKILLVTLDTVSAGHLASYGGRVPMPVLDALGAVRVVQAGATTAWWAPWLLSGTDNLGKVAQLTTEGKFDKEYFRKLGDVGADFLYMFVIP